MGDIRGIHDIDGNRGIYEMGSATMTDRFSEFTRCGNTKKTKAQIGDHCRRRSPTGVLYGPIRWCVSESAGARAEKLKIKTCQGLKAKASNVFSFFSLYAFLHLENLAVIWIIWILMLRCFTAAMDVCFWARGVCWQFLTQMNLRVNQPRR